MKILQIVPQLPPVICGVGDYALELARAWRPHGVDTCFLGCDPAWQGEGREFPCATVARRSGAALCESLVMLHGSQKYDCVVLHFSGYGYGRRGAPVWMVNGLKLWRQRMPTFPLLTMFHELYATGAPTSSAFWFGPVQKWVCAQLALLSTHLRTNRTASASWLCKVVPEKEGKVRVLPVFSNFGEMPAAAPPSTRPAHLVVFGHQANEWPLLQNSLLFLLRSLRPTRLTILRQGLNLPHECSHTMEVVQKEALPAPEVSRILCSAAYGILAYHPEYLGKSGILAAYCAHGVAPLLVNVDGALPEGLEVNRHVLAASAIAGPLPGAALDRISQEGRNWYEPHNITATAQSYLEQIAAR